MASPSAARNPRSVGSIARQSSTSTSAPRARASFANARSSAVLPTPAMPCTNTTGAPGSSSSARSRSRPISAAARSSSRVWSVRLMFGLRTPQVPAVTRTNDWAMTTVLDQARVQEFAFRLAEELGAALNAALVNIGDRLGLYAAMADAQPVTAAELAGRTGTHERYVREWLNAQAAGGIVDYDA